LRSDREHCGSRVAVEQEDEEYEEDDEEEDDEEEEEEERRRRGGGEEEEEEQATDIKSNNPHLAGGEKTNNYSKTIEQIIAKAHTQAHQDNRVHSLSSRRNPISLANIPPRNQISLGFHTQCEVTCVQE